MNANYRETKNELVSCPFNPSHKVKKCRLITHKKICPDKENNGYVICPYNPNHHVSIENLEKHKVKCPNKVVLNSELEKEMEEYIKNKKNIKLGIITYKSPKKEKENTQNNQNEIEGLKIKKKKNSVKKAKKEEIKEKAIDLENISNKELFNFIFNDKMVCEYDSDDEKNDENKDKNSDDDENKSDYSKEEETIEK